MSKEVSEVWINFCRPVGTYSILKKTRCSPTNPNAHTYVNGTDVETHGYAVTQNTFLKQFI